MYSKNLAIALASSVMTFLTFMLITFDYFKSVSFSQPQESMVKYESFDASLYKAALPNLTPRLTKPKVEKVSEVKKPIVKEEFKPSKKVEVVKEKPETVKAPTKIITNNSNNSGISALNSLVKEKKDTLWTVETTNNVIVNNPTEMASPIGGLAEFIKYIQRNIVYPPQAKANNQEGTVYVQFTVDIDGSVT
ncbi:MAG: energy transducer TonB, partial [Cytophagales bacterium]|nr:energy transducer TonB [Cytophagales bacterium]